MNPTITIETINPSIAQLVLEHHNPKNRTLRMQRVRQYADEMRRGQWKLAGDPIRFDADGILLDGQHRLRAIVEAGLAMEFVVIRGLESDTFTVMDKGLNRGVGDALGSDVKQATHKAAALRLLYVVKNGGDPRKTEDRYYASRTDIVTLYNADAENIDQQTLNASQMYNAVGGNRSAWIAFYLMLGEVEGFWKPVQFLEGLHTGAGMEAGDARLALRNWLSGKYNQHKQMSGDHLALYIKSWNLFYKDKQVQRLLMPNSTDAFPQMLVK